MKKYTVSVNHGEYTEGIYDTKQEAWQKVREVIQKEYPEEYQEIIDPDEIWDLADNLGYHVEDIYTGNTIKEMVEDMTGDVIQIEILEYTDFDETTRQALLVDGEVKQTIRDLSDVPEDAIIHRDLLNAHDLISFIKFGQGLAGKELDVTHKEVDSEEWERRVW